MAARMIDNRGEGGLRCMQAIVHGVGGRRQRRIQSPEIGSDDWTCEILVQFTSGSSQAANLWSPDAKYSGLLSRHCAEGAADCPRPECRGPVRKIDRFNTEGVCIMARKLIVLSSLVALILAATTSDAEAGRRRRRCCGYGGGYGHCCPASCAAPCGQSYGPSCGAPCGQSYGPSCGAPCGQAYGPSCGAPCGVSCGAPCGACGSACSTGACGSACSACSDGGSYSSAPMGAAPAQDAPEPPAEPAPAPAPQR
jgi:hypothetical protein